MRSLCHHMVPAQCCLHTVCVDVLAVWAALRGPELLKGWIRVTPGGLQQPKGWFRVSLAAQGVGEAGTRDLWQP